MFTDDTGYPRPIKTQNDNLMLLLLAAADAAFWLVIGFGLGYFWK